LRRCFAAILAALIVLFLFPVTSRAEYTKEVTANCAIMVDASTGTALYEKNSQAKAYPASTTKLMTALVVLENVSDLETEVTVGAEVRRFSENNTLIGLVEKEKVRVIDLLYGMLLPSGNDAAATLACYVGGSIDGFAQLMNNKARELGMNDTHFVNPHGLNNEQHYTTAADMAKLAVACSKNETLMEIVGSRTYTLPPTNKRSSSKTITNTNKFLDPNTGYDCVTGMKTGNTSAAKYCLVTSAEKDGKKLIVVILGDASENGTARWTETRSLLEYGFENLATMPLSALRLSPVKVQVAGYGRNDAEAGMLTLEYDTGSQSISGLKEDLNALKLNADKIVVTVNYLSDHLDAPVLKGDVVGTAALSYEGETIAVVNLVASRDVLASGDTAIVSSSNGIITGVTRTPIEDEKSSPVLTILLVLVGLGVCGTLLYFSRFGRKLRKKRQKQASSADGHSFYIYKGKLQ
jgi:D-alanyl-D-alanine carboxypeptidase (penicillin-binding protein 5/6)